MIRAKFVCQSITKMQHWSKPGEFLFKAEFTPVTYDGSPENKLFFEATPGGRVELATLRSDNFVPGKAYYIDFEEAPE